MSLGLTSCVSPTELTNTVPPGSFSWGAGVLSSLFAVLSSGMDGSVTSHGYSTQCTVDRARLFPE